MTLSNRDISSRENLNVKNTISLLSRPATCEVVSLGACSLECQNCDRILKKNNIGNGNWNALLGSIA